MSSMNQGYLSDFFDGVAVKRLSAVEVNQQKSNQHEFNASAPLRKLLGEPDRKQFDTRFLWITDEEEDRAGFDGFLTLYQSRKPPRSEYRLYFPSNPVMEEASEGDFLFICQKKSGDILLVLCPESSSIANQLLWLFSLDDPGGQFHTNDLFSDLPTSVGFIARHILEEIGIEVDQSKDEYLDQILDKFGPLFPPTKEFSLFARETLKDISALEDPDGALVAWMDHEELLFRALERHIVSERLSHGFEGQDGPDVDGFISFSLSVQNRRKSRVGHAFEHHLNAVFRSHKLSFERGAKTEGKSKPDFLFPGSREYHDAAFPAEQLFMLGVKTTCKDRWRQVLAEAERIQCKHLLTLQPGISEPQTDEMQANNLQLVLPHELHQTCSPAQQKWLWDLKDFISTVKKPK